MVGRSSKQAVGLRTLALITSLSAGVFGTSIPPVAELYITADVRSALVVWNYPILPSVRAFALRRCTISKTRQPPECSSQVIPRTLQLPASVSRTVQYSVTVRELSANTLYKFQVTPINRWLERECEAARASVIRTKQFGAVTRCLQDRMEVTVETGAYFGGRLRVSRDPSESCQLRGDRMSHQRNYTLVVNYQLCLTQRRGSTVKTTVIAEDDNTEVAENSKIFLAVCNYTLPQQDLHQTDMAEYSVEKSQAGHHQFFHHIHENQLNQEKMQNSNLGESADKNSEQMFKDLTPDQEEHEYRKWKSNHQQYFQLNKQSSNMSQLDRSLDNDKTGIINVASNISLPESNFHSTRKQIGLRRQKETQMDGEKLMETKNTSDSDTQHLLLSPKTLIENDRKQNMTSVHDEADMSSHESIPQSKFSLPKMAKRFHRQNGTLKNEISFRKPLTEGEYRAQLRPDLSSNQFASQAVNQPIRNNQQEANLKRQNSSTVHIEFATVTNKNNSGRNDIKEESHNSLLVAQKWPVNSTTTASSQPPIIRNSPKKMVDAINSIKIPLFRIVPVERYESTSTDGVPNQVKDRSSDRSITGKDIPSPIHLRDSDNDTSIAGASVLTTALVLVLLTVFALFLRWRLSKRSRFNVVEPKVPSDVKHVHIVGNYPGVNC